MQRDRPTDTGRVGDRRKGGTDGGIRIGIKPTDYILYTLGAALEVIINYSIQLLCSDCRPKI